MENESPLKKFQRQPKIYIDLPSKGKYYKSPGILYEDSYTNLAVFSMTANDEILYKTPDALINGQATASNMQSCIPSILKPFDLVSIDVDAILLAIRMATYGSTMSVSQKCIHCGEENTYEVELQKYINHLNGLTFEDSLMYQDFKINVSPLTYQQYTDLQKESVGYQRAMSIQLPAIVEESERDKFRDKILREIAQLNLKTILLSLKSIDIEGETETDIKAIFDFIENYDVKMYQAIKDHINAQYEAWLLPVENVVCAACGKENQLRITVDQTDFFAKG